MDLNIEIFYFIHNGMRNPFFDVIMPSLTNMGGFVSLLLICILAILVFRYLKKDEYMEIAKKCLYALVIAGIIAGILKLLVHHPRPFTVLDNVRQLVIPSEPNSFPSGHTASTLSIVTVLVSTLRQHKLVVCLLILFGFLIGFSRIYSGVHYPLDVVVGAVVGILSGVLVLKLKV